MYLLLLFLAFFSRLRVIESFCIGRNKKNQQKCGGSTFGGTQSNSFHYLLAILLHHNAFEFLHLIWLFSTFLYFFTFFGILFLIFTYFFPFFARLLAYKFGDYVQIYICTYIHTNMHSPKTAACVYMCACMHFVAIFITKYWLPQNMLQIYTYIHTLTSIYIHIDVHMCEIMCHYFKLQRAPLLS